MKLPTAVNQGPYISGPKLNPGVAFDMSNSRALGVACTITGTINVTMQSGDVIPIPIVPGWQVLPLMATEYTLSGGAAATVYNMA